MNEPSMKDMVQVFGRVGLLSFGGPAAQIALMHKELVEDRPWMTEKDFLTALSFCMLLPGPEAMQLATYAGWQKRGVLGGLVAGGLFVIPGAIVIAALCLIYASFGAQPFVQAIFLGVKATIIVVVFQALRKVAGKALQGRSHWLIAAFGFVALFALQAPFPVVILLAGLWGALSVTANTAPVDAPRVDLPSIGSSVSKVAFGLCLWAAPILAAMVFQQDLLVQIGLFFSKLAIVTFGGAYAVLAYMTQQVVQEQGWLTTAQMMDGLGLAETTPGPLILVTQFVAGLTGHGAGGIGLAFLAMAMTLWVTFVPCFLWIFTGAPYIAHLTTAPRLRGALAGITAAVVGVIANLSIWFAAHVFFGEVGVIQSGWITVIMPDIQTVNLLAIGLALVAFWLLILRETSLPKTLGLMALAGWATTTIWTSLM
jgi:chromate transporter